MWFIPITGEIKKQVIRCSSIERAYESLSIETVSSKKIKELLGKVWNDIIGSSLPVIDGGQVVSIKNPIFQDTTRGSSIVTCSINFHTGDGNELASLLRMEYANDQPFELEFKNIKIGETTQDEVISLSLEKPAISDSDLKERENNLKELIKG